jgi:hypothetical protein
VGGFFSFNHLLLTLNFQPSSKSPNFTPSQNQTLMHKITLTLCSMFAIFIIGCAGSEEEKEETTDNPTPKDTTEMVDTLAVVEDTVSIVEPVEPIDISGCWKSATLDSLMKTVAVNEDPDDWEVNAVLPDDVVAGLSAEEVLAYCLNYPGSFSQNCAMEMSPDDPDQYLLSYLPMSEEELSSQQEEALKNKAGAVSAVISSCLKGKAPLHGSLTNVIVGYGGYLCIPAIWENYEMTKNSELLTLMCLLMMTDKYDAFMTSDLNDQLYVNGKPYKETKEEMEMSFFPYGIELTPSVLEKLKTLSTDFYKWKSSEGVE